MSKDTSKNSVAIKSLETLIRNIQSSYDCLQFDTKRIKPCIDALLNQPTGDNTDSETMAIKDLVNRLSVAEEKLAESMCLIQDALSSVSIGCKSYKSVKK